MIISICSVHTYAAWLYMYMSELFIHILCMCMCLTVTALAVNFTMQWECKQNWYQLQHTVLHTCTLRHGEVWIVMVVVVISEETTHTTPHHHTWFTVLEINITSYVCHSCSTYSHFSRFGWGHSVSSSSCNRAGFTRVCSFSSRTLGYPCVCHHVQHAKHKA